MVGEHVQFRSEKWRQTEARIIRAAAELFLEHGFRATTVRAIASAAEVSVGRVMSVGDKDAILVACFDRWIGQLQDGTYSPPPRRASLSKRGAGVSATPAVAAVSASAGAAPNTSAGAAPRASAGTGVTANAAYAAAPGPPRATSAVQRHLLELFLPFLEFFAAHEDLSRDYAAAMMRVKAEPEVFNALALDLQGRLSESLISIGIGDGHARASAAALYDSYLGILFRWAATTMTLSEASDALLATIAFHTRARGPL